MTIVTVVGAVAGCGAERRVSEASLRNATADGAAAVLLRHGYRMHGPLHCATQGHEPNVRIRCVGTTVDGAAVRVDGLAHAPRAGHPRQQYTILVDGRTVAREPCLGPYCQRERTRSPAW